jgi:hypothetical protein
MARAPDAVSIGRAVQKATMSLSPRSPIRPIRTSCPSALARPPRPINDIIVDVFTDEESCRRTGIAGEL